MAEYTIVSVADVPDQAAEVGMDPEHFEIRFLRESLDLRNFSVTFERFGGGWQPPQGHPHRRGHRHTIQEEVYFLVSGRAQGKFGGEVVDIAPWDSDSREVSASDPRTNLGPRPDAGRLLCS